MRKILSFVVFACSIGFAACGHHDSPTEPSSTSAQPASFDYTRGAVQSVGLTSKGEGYGRWYGNLNSLETSIPDWNGVQFNWFVTNTDTGRVTKFLAEYPNGTVDIPSSGRRDDIILRTGDSRFGSAVKFELRVIVNPRLNLTYVQVRYGRKNDPSMFQLLPETLTIGADFFTTGPLPKMDAATAARIGASSVSHAQRIMDEIVESRPMSKSCVVPLGATDCEAR